MGSFYYFPVCGAESQFFLALWNLIAYLHGCHQYSCTIWGWDLFFTYWYWWPRLPLDVSLPPSPPSLTCTNQGSVTEGKSNSAIIVLNLRRMLFNLTPRAMKGKFWESKVLGSVALFIFLFWKTDHTAMDSPDRTPVLCPFPSLLTGSAVVPTAHSCWSAHWDCFSQLWEAPATVNCRFASMASLSSWPFFPPLFSFAHL